MSGETFPFSPILPTVNRTTNTGSQSVALGTVGRSEPTPGASSNSPTFAGGFTLRIVNDGTVTIFFAIGYGTAATASATTSTPMLPGTTEVFTVAESATHISTICASGTSTVYATPGQGN